MNWIIIREKLLKFQGQTLLVCREILSEGRSLLRNWRSTRRNFFIKLIKLNCKGKSEAKIHSECRFLMPQISGLGLIRRPKVSWLCRNRCSRHLQGGSVWGLSENSCARVTAGIFIPVPISTPEAIQLKILPCRNVVLVSTFRPRLLSGGNHGVKRFVSHSPLKLTADINLYFLQHCSNQHRATRNLES
jgi:hypothetical protein